MKLKKFFAGVLAAAMMLTVGATAAFATEGNNQSDNVTNSFPGATITSASTLELTKNYKVESGKAPFEEFEFTVSYVGAIKKDTNVTAEPTNLSITKYANFTANTAEVPEGATGLPASKTYKEKFEIAMSELKIPTGGTGIYVYKITEADKGTPAVAYNTDGGNLYLIVTVTHVTNGDGVIQDGQYNYAVALRRSGADITSANVADAAKGVKVLNTNAFNNTYGAGTTVNSVELKKTVHGNFGDLGKDFTFNVTFNKAVDKNYGNIAFEAENGRKVYKANDSTQTGVNELEYGVEYVVTLKHGETIEFGNLPADVTYTMVENGKQDVEGTQKVDGIYTVTGEKTEDNKGTVTASATTAKEEIVNTNQESPDMGVVLDNAPYIAMLAIVAIGGVALMLNKRRRDEE